MRRSRHSPFLYALLAALWCVPVVTPADAPDVVGTEVREELDRHGTVRVIITLRMPAVERTDRAALMREVAAAQDAVLEGLQAGDLVMQRRFRAVAAMVVEIDATALAALEKHPRVLRIDIDPRMRATLSQSVPMINADLLHLGGFTGVGTTVAVIDTGVDTDHPDLTDDLVDEACFCALCCAGGSSVQFGPGSAEDDNGHGSNVAGIVTSAGTIAPLGVAPDADLVAIKVLAADGTGFAGDAIAGLDWIISDKPEVDVINLSLGTFALYAGDCDNSASFTQAYADAINTLRQNGVATFASSGNDASGVAMGAPACISNAISVGAVYDGNLGARFFQDCTDLTTAADQITCFSNASTTTDVLAPGGAITSTAPGGVTSTFFGTSQASPHAAGCALDLMQINPAWDVDTLEAALEGTGIPRVDPKNGMTYPRIDCQAATGAMPQLVEDSHLVVDTGTGNGNGVPEPGDVLTMIVDLRNIGAIAATGVSAVLSSTTPAITIRGPTASWVDIQAFDVRTSSPPHFQVEVDASLACGSVIDLDLAISSNQGPSNASFQVQIGARQEGSWLSADTPIAVPDNDAGGASSMLNIPASFLIGDVTATVDIAHTAIGDLVVELTSPGATTVRLHSNSGGTDDDLQTTYDTITLPDGPGSMSDFDGENVSGNWTLKVVDSGTGETGTIQSWSLAAEEATFTCAPVPCLMTAAAAATPAVVCDGNPSTLADDGSTPNGTDCSGTLEYRFQLDSTVLQDWSADDDLDVFPSTTTIYLMRARDLGTLAQASAFPSVTVLPSPTASVSQAQEPACTELDAVDLDAGAGFTSYTWRDDGDSVVGTAQTLALDATACGRTYTLEVTNADACLDTAAHLATCTACAPAEVSGPGSTVPLRMGIDTAGTIEFELLVDPSVTYSLYNAVSVAAMLAGDWTWKYCDLKATTFGTWNEVNATTVQWTPLLPTLIFEGSWVVIAEKLGVEGSYGMMSSGSPRPPDLNAAGSSGSPGCP